jgi:hypothetical protein
MCVHIVPPAGAITQATPTDGLQACERLPVPGVLIMSNFNKGRPLSDKERVIRFIAYWRKRVTPERLREKIINEFGSQYAM